jgi:hypothetical protein
MISSCCRRALKRRKRSGFKHGFISELDKSITSNFQILVIHGSSKIHFLFVGPGTKVLLKN